MSLKNLFLVTLFISEIALAQRYMVTFKNHDLHHSIVSQSNRVQLQSYMNSQGYTLTADKIESHLNALDTVIVKDLSVKDAESLRNNRNVLFVEKEIKRPLPFPVGMFKKPILNKDAYRFFEQDRPWGINAINTGVTWNVTSGGAGARVLVLDTGIDRDHPSVRPNLENAKDFVGDNQAGYSYRDTIGHGTHVAGTIAGVLDRSGFSGVAPTARLLAGRVCAEDGCSNIAIAEGINWGVEQKVDVISMSLGGAWSSMAERIAIKKAYEAGITIVAASGNDGTNTVGYPAALPECIAVGAVDSDLKRADFSQFGPELAIVAPGVDVMSSVPLASGRESLVQFSEGAARFQKVKSSVFQGSKTILKPFTADVVHAGLGQEDDFKMIDVAGKIALIQRGELKFSEKVANALKANAAGVIIYNNAPGMLNGTLTEDGSELDISVYMIEQTSGEAMAKAIKDGQFVKAKVASIITNHASMSGTSMATPHVSGVIALMKAVNRGLTPEQVRVIIASTAKKVSNDTVNETGAGLIQADMAVRAAMQMQPAAP